MNQTRRATWEKWQRIIEAQRSSGQTATAYCRDHGITLACFFAWKRRLRPASRATEFVELKPAMHATPANVPMIPGPGGSVRPGWFSNLYSFDLLDNKIEDDIDATDSTPPSLVTTYEYDFNQNLIKITKPMGNTVNYDYDERNMRIASRIGYDPATDQPGSITVSAFDGNGNLLDSIGPMKRGTAANSLTVIIDDAFGGSSALTHSGDWVVQNQYDGFDRLIQSTDAVGGIRQSTIDPNGRTVAMQLFGTAGGATPMDRSGSANTKLSSNESFFDEAGRAYDSQSDVFLNTTGGNSVPSGRTITQTGGGLAANSTTNNHTGTVTLTAGGTSYVLTRQVFDRANRVVLIASDNTAQTVYTFDGANRRLTMTDALGNIQQLTYDANGNAISATSVQACTISDSIPTESFGSLMFYDVLNRRVINARQGADGSLSSYFPPGTDPATSNTLFTLTGYDSRGNATNSIDPKQNTAVSIYDGASRQIQTQQHLRIDGDGTQAIASTILTQQYLDGNSRPIRLIDNNGGTTLFAYDILDRQMVTTFHDGSTRTNVYNLASNVYRYTDENGSIFHNTFDCLGRKATVAITAAAGVDPSGTTSQNFQYDGMNHLIVSNDISATSANAMFVFDSLSRTLEEIQTAVTGGFVTLDAWTGLTPTSLTYSSGRQIGMAYDLLYRKNGVTETADSSSIAAWQFFGPRTATVTLGNGLVTSYMNNGQTRSAIQQGQTTPAWGDITTDHLGYDGVGRLIGKRHFNGSGVIVGNLAEYDQSSKKLLERALHAESRSSLYDSFDSMNRLLDYERGTLLSGGASISSPITLPGTNQEQSYNLDGLGNWSTTTITPEGGTAATQNRVHNKLNEVTDFGGTPVLYDHGNNIATAYPNRGNGNIANDGTQTFAYDALNRLTTVYRKSDGMQIGQYVYDAVGRRIQKVVSNGGITGMVANGLTNYIYRGQQCHEEGNDVIATRQFVWGRYIDEMILMKTFEATGAQDLPAGDYYPLSDLLYRTQALTDSSGTIQETYDCDAYGNTLIFQAAGTGGNWWADDAVTSDQPVCENIFCGYRYDPETQLYYVRTRILNPLLGRWIQSDGGYWDGMNLYQYVRSNPMIHIDPTGRDPGQVAGQADQGLWVPDGPIDWSDYSAQGPIQYTPVVWNGTYQWTFQDELGNCFLQTVQTGTYTRTWTQLGTQHGHYNNVQQIATLAAYANATNQQITALSNMQTQLQTQALYYSNLANQAFYGGVAADVGAIVLEAIPGGQLAGAAVAASSLVLYAESAQATQTSNNLSGQALGINPQITALQQNLNNTIMQIASIPATSPAPDHQFTRVMHDTLTTSRVLNTVQINCCMLFLQQLLGLDYLCEP